MNIIDPHDDPMGYAHTIGEMEEMVAKTRHIAKNAERAYYRIRDSVLVTLDKSFGSADQRQAKARLDERAVAAEHEWLKAELAYQTTLARRDAARIKWETWRTMMANTREEMRRIQ